MENHAPVRLNLDPPRTFWALYVMENRVLGTFELGLIKDILSLEGYEESCAGYV